MSELCHIAAVAVIQGEQSEHTFAMQEAVLTKVFATLQALLSSSIMFSNFMSIYQRRAESKEKAEQSNRCLSWVCQHHPVSHCCIRCDCPCAHSRRAASVCRSETMLADIWQASALSWCHVFSFPHHLYAVHPEMQHLPVLLIGSCAAVNGKCLPGDLIHVPLQVFTNSLHQQCCTSTEPCAT